MSHLYEVHPDTEHVSLEFEDFAGQTVTAHHRSHGTPLLLLGTHLNHRMHLSQQDVRDLLPYLEHFAATGRLVSVAPNHHERVLALCEQYLPTSRVMLDLHELSLKQALTRAISNAVSEGLADSEDVRLLRRALEHVKQHGTLPEAA